MIESLANDIGAPSRAFEGEGTGVDAPWGPSENRDIYFLGETALPSEPHVSQREVFAGALLAQAVPEVSLLPGRSGFIDPELEITSWEDLAPYFDALLAREINSVEDLQTLILHHGELEAVFKERLVVVRYGSIVHQENKEYKERARVFTRIKRKFERANEELIKEIQQNPFYDDLPAAYDCYKASFEKPAPDFTGEEKERLDFAVSVQLAQYRRLTKKLPIQIEGRAVSLQDAKALMRSEDRETRRAAWVAVHQAYLENRSEFDSAFFALFNSRWMIAEQAGFDTPQAYYHRQEERTATDTQVFCDAVRTNIAPLARKLLEVRRERVGLSREDFAPFDAESTPAHLGSFAPYEQQGELLDKTLRAIGQVHPDLECSLIQVLDKEFIDVERNEDKNPRAEMLFLPWSQRAGFIMQANQSYRDFKIASHELGHALHYSYASNQPLYYWQASFSSETHKETMAMGMEYMTAEHAEPFYEEEEKAAYYRQQLLENSVFELCWFAMMTSFEQWLFTDRAGLNALERENKFLQLMKDYGLHTEEWAVYDDLMATRWMQSSLLWGSPLGWLDYGEAQTGALQIYRNYVNDPETTTEQYISVMQQGNTNSMSALWQEMGIEYDFSDEMVAGLATFIEQRLAEIGAE